MEGLGIKFRDAFMKRQQIRINIPIALLYVQGPVQGIVIGQKLYTF